MNFNAYMFHKIIFNNNFNLFWTRTLFLCKLYLRLLWHNMPGAILFVSKRHNCACGVQHPVSTIGTMQQGTLVACIV